MNLSVGKCVALCGAETSSSEVFAHMR
jgi:hypothetical protein